MVRNKKFRLILALMAALLTGCLGTDGVYREIDTKRGIISYIHNSPLRDDKSNIKIYGEFQNSANVPLNPIVTQYDSFTLPLLFINFGSTSQEIILGQRNIEENYFDFLKSSYYEEASLSGDFIPVDEKAGSDYYFMLKLDSCRTYTFFEEDVVAGLGGRQHSMSIRPGVTYLELRIEFYRTKDNELIFKDKIKFQRYGEYIHRRFISTNEIFKHAVINMAESFSNSIRDFISYLVSKSNLVVGKYHKDK